MWKRNYGRPSEAREIKLAKYGSPKVRNRDIGSREAED